MKAAPPKADGLDPEIRSFVRFLRRRAEQYPGSADLPIREQRRIAEEVRRPLATGGPTPAHVQDYQVPVAEREVRVRVMNGVPGEQRPCLVFLHGGGWMLFSLDTHDRMMRELAVRAGIVVAGIDYSLAPELRFPGQLDEIRAVVAWLGERGGGVGIDAKNVCIGGDSAGANLALATCMSLRDAGRQDVIRGMLLCYGVYDGTFDTESYDRYGDARYNLGRDEMRGFWAGYVASSSDYANPLASPLRADLSGLPPAFMIVAECDVLHDENLAMAAKMAECGVDVRHKVYPGTTHSFLEAVPMAKVSEEALADAAAWLESLSRPRARE